MYSKFYNSIFYLTPLFLINGPFLSDLSACTLGIFAIYIFKKKLIKFSSTEINIFFFTLLIFNIYIFLRSSFSQDYLLSYESSLFYFRFTLYCFAIIYLYYLDNNILFKFSFIVVISILFLSLDSIFEFIFGFRLVGNNSPGFEYGRISSFFVDELIMGSFISKMLPFFVIFFHLKFLENHKKNLLYFFILFLVLVFFSVYLSGERTALFNTLIIYSVLILSITNINLIKKFISLLIFYLIIFTFIFSYTNSHSDRIIKNTYTQLFESNNSFNYFSLDHEAHFRSAFSMFNSNMIFGHGSKMFRKLCSDNSYSYFILSTNEVVPYEKSINKKINKNGCSTHPHHFYIQQLAENGIIGFLFLLSFFIYMVKVLISNLINKYYLFDSKYFPLFIINFSLLLIFNPFIPSMNFFNNWLSVIIYIHLGFLLALNNKFKMTKF